MYQGGLGQPVEQLEARSPWGSVIKTVLVFTSSALLIYLLLTAPTHWKRLEYWLAHYGQANEPEEFVDLEATGETLSAAVGAALRSPRFPSQIPTADSSSTTPAAEPVNATSQAVAATLGLADNHLVIPKLEVRVPIVWNSASDEPIMLANLQQGIAHYGFTALPNPETGNVFLTGHSSYYWWDKGKYKTVFALLDRLTAGDQAFIQFSNQVFVYSMRDSVVVNPSDVSVTDPTDQPTLSLMTCTPVGTALRRLVVRFDLARVFPADATTTLTDRPAPETPPAEAAAPAVTPAVPSVPRDRDVIRLLPAL